MQYLNLLVERSLIFLFVLCFGLVALYTPQSFNEIQKAEAAAMADISTFSQQLIMELTQLAIQADGYQTMVATTNSFALDNVIDGGFWAASRDALSSMTSEIVNWVNSGPDGKGPAFVTNLEGFLLETGDEAHTEYITNLNGPNSFLCEPFKLDVVVAVEKTYIQNRENASNGLPAPRSCVLTGPVEHLGDFVDGSQTFSDAGGWATWFAVTNNPTQYTPFGSYQAAQIEDAAQVAEAERNETKLLDFGQGFLSTKICEAVESVGGSKKNCTITTPGKVINEALNFALSSGSRSWIEADEINELLTGAFAYLQQTAITGTAGLLGLSGGTGYTYSGKPYTSKLLDPMERANPNDPGDLIRDRNDGDDNFQIIDPPPFIDN